MNAIVAINAIEMLIQSRRPRQKKCYKKRINSFLLRDLCFKIKYRFSKETVRRIIDLVQNDLIVDTRGAGTSPELQVLVAIRCWGRREVQDDAGDLHGLSQPTVSRICARVSRALARNASTFIKMPHTVAEQQRVVNNFRTIRNFPGVIGAIDCTHIKIRKPSGDQAQYYINRKGYYSLNVQVVCDANLKIMDIVARWRGSTHDSRIFNESQIKQNFEEGQYRGRLLGDSGYPLLPYLFTPILRPSSVQEERYNEAQIGTRNTIERCFGVWKQRFQCLLHGLPCELRNGKAVIVALAVLHNIAIDMNDNVLDEDDITLTETQHSNTDYNNENDVTNVQPRVLRRRAQFILQNFIRENF